MTYVGSNPVLKGRTGFEIELLAPRGASRADLAALLATSLGGTVRPGFHLDSEPSLVPGMGHFLTLTQAFDVYDGKCRQLCSLVDDVTINGDLDRAAGARQGWFRILSDDARLLRLTAALVDPSAPLDSLLDPVAAAFNTAVTVMGDVARLDDASGATVALAAVLGGERERPCEIVTPPLTHDHLAHLERLLLPARELGFAVPLEAAVHLHVDAAPFRNVAAFSNVVRLFGNWREALWAALGTNPRCKRLNGLPPSLLALVERPWQDWSALKAATQQCGLTKFCDVNLTKVIADRPDRHTLEIRILPGSIEGVEIMALAALVEGLLARCQEPQPFPRPSEVTLEGQVHELLALAAI